jgi:hypothetical protein
MPVIKITPLTEKKSLLPDPEFPRRGHPENIHYLGSSPKNLKMIPFRPTGWGRTIILYC